MPAGVPADYGALIAQLAVGDARAAIDFYRRALGARELYRQVDGDGRRIVHCELLVGLSRFIVHDEFAEAGLLSPQTLGGTCVTLMHYVEDVDLACRSAVDAGATLLTAPEDRFWGLRSGMILDPFGHRWLLATQIEDLSPQEIADRARQAPAAERLPGGRRPE